MNGFLPIPAIDILAGTCVRLEQGDYARVTAYATDPVAQVLQFAAAGARRLHIVDLDGAREGKPVNHQTIAAMATAIAREFPDALLQVGGGLRSMATVEQALAAGASMVIVGTAAINEPTFLREACAEFAGKILLGLDTRDGKLAIRGWQETTDLAATEFAQLAVKLGIAGIIHTDITRDGLLAGPNQQATTTLAQQVDCPVYASGGVACLSDLEAMHDSGIAGAIIGKAIYVGKIDVAELFGPRGMTS